MSAPLEGQDGRTRPTLRARRLGLHTQGQPIVLMRTDCHVCRSEGLASRTQVLVSASGRDVQALLFQVESQIIALDEVALSEGAWRILGVAEGDAVLVSHAPPVESLASVRSRLHGHRLDQAAYASIVADVVKGRYTDVHLSAFLTAGAALPLDDEETAYLTSAMIGAGETIRWQATTVLDKHCIGGLPGNRTTPIVVAIVAACGLVMPKTSSRAITSPAGTADAMETLAPVDLDLPTLRRVVAAEGGCVAWGGSVHLSPADDIFVRIERELDVDTEGQLIASVLSKKIAAGSTHVVIDIPVGPTAKVRSEEAWASLSARLEAVGAGFGIKVTCLRTDGLQPVGRGIGPALEAQDVLAVLRNETGAPDDLRQRSAILAGAALEIGGAAKAGTGVQKALAAIADGRALRKLEQICEAQGGMRVPPIASHRRPLTSPKTGRIVQVNNRKLARLAKLAGAPLAKAAGITMAARLGEEVDKGQPILIVHAETSAELAYAFDYVNGTRDIISVEA